MIIMMKNLTGIFVLAAACAHAGLTLSLVDEVYTNSSPQFLKAVDFSDSLNGWAAGFDPSMGLMMKTADGGSTWELYRDFDAYTNVQMLSPTTGYALTRAGKIKKTTDNRTWVVQPGVPESQITKIQGLPTPGIVAMEFRTVDTGLVAIGYSLSSSTQVFHTENAGLTWTESKVYWRSADSLIAYPSRFEDFQFLDRNTVYAGGDVFLKSEDGGRTWIYSGFGGGYNESRINFSDKSRGSWLAKGTLFRTENGGAEWTASFSPGKKKIFDVAYLGRDTVLALGDSGFFALSFNGGLNWDTASYPYLRSTVAMHAASLDKILFFGGAIVKGVWIVTPVSTKPRQARKRLSLRVTKRAAVLIHDSRSGAGYSTDGKRSVPSPDALKM